MCLTWPDYPKVPPLTDADIDPNLPEDYCRDCRDQRRMEKPQDNYKYIKDHIPRTWTNTHRMVDEQQAEIICLRNIIKSKTFSSECPYGDNYIEARRLCSHVKLMNEDMLGNTREYTEEIARLNAQLRDAIQRIGELQMVVDRNHTIKVPMRDQISQSEIDGFNKWRERATTQVELDKVVIQAMARKIHEQNNIYVGYETVIEIIDNFTKQAEASDELW